MLDRTGEDRERGVNSLLLTVQFNQRQHPGYISRSSLQELTQLALCPLNVALGQKYVRPDIPKRARSIDYKHVIHSLAKKPNAFKCSQLRDDLIPKGDFWQLWQQLTSDGVTDVDCRYMVDLLLIAHNYHCEAALGRYVLNAFDTGCRASIKQCRTLFGPDKIEIPIIISQQHQIASYDSLLGGLHG